MNVESDGRYIAMLGRMLRDARRLQNAGRLRDVVSRREIAFLTRQLEVLQARSAEAEQGGSRTLALADAGGGTFPSLGLPEMAEQREPRTDFDFWWESEADEEWEALGGST